MKKKIVTGILVGCSVMLLMLLGCVSQSEFDSLKLERDQITVEHNQIVAEKEQLVLDYDQCKVELELITAELGDIKVKYPPRPFENVMELTEWLNTQPDYPASADALVWFQRGLTTQKAATEDGFIISVELISEDEDGLLFSVFCTAVLADGGLYWWDPDTHDVYYWLDSNHF